MRVRARLSRLFLVGLAACVVAGVAFAAAAQNRTGDGQAEPQPPVGEQLPAPPVLPPNPTVEEPKPPVAPALAPSQLDTFLLRDSKGNLVPVLGLPFEEFEQLLRLKKGLAPPAAPGYVLESLSLAGKADNEAANFQLTATVRVRDAGWQKIPLLMPRAVIRQPPKYEGSGEHLLTFDEKAGGYVFWLKGGGENPHIIRIPVSVGLTTASDERRLAITLPKATEAALRLTVPGADAEALLLGGEGILTRSTSGNQTELTVLGSAGELQLAWGRGPAARSGPTQLDASGEIVVRVESEHRITSDARLRVRSYGGALETFRVRLPPGMELLPLPSTGGYSVTQLPQSPAPPAAGKLPAGQVVELRLDKPTTAAMEVRLIAQLQSDAATPAALTPARFEVLSAARQRGQIDFTVDGEWQLEWKEDKSVHRLDLAPDTAAARVVARFEYFRQPCGLELKVEARPSRVSVEPTHMIYLDPQQVRVETHLKYRFRGARAASLGFELADWEFDRLTPDTLLELPVVAAETDKVEVPFRAEAAPPTELELRLEAHRKLPPKTERLALSFPRPVADVVAPATVVIFAADNIELTPQIMEIVGLSPDPTTIRVPGRQQPPLMYRDVGAGEPAQFVGLMRTRSRTTTAAGRALVRLDRQQAHIEQRLDYRVAHEPQRTFVLAGPRAVLAAGNVQVWLDGEPLTAALRPSRPGLAADQAEVEFTAPMDRIGAFQVEVKYTLPLSLAAQEPTPLALPLVLPAEEGEYQFTGQRVEFSLADRLEIEPHPDWDEDLTAEEVRGTSGTLAYTWSQPLGASHWLVRPSQGLRGAAITIARMWIQTWLAGATRQERVVFRLTTPQETVRVRLPRGVRQASVLAAVDAREAPVVVHDPVAIVTLPAAARARPCVLEICYTLDAPAARLGMMTSQFRPAQIEEAVAPRRVYWQLGLPEQEQLLGLPADLAVEMSWAADRWPLWRRPIMDQRQLEAWIEASGQETLPQGTNEYLFGALGRWPTLEVAVIQRRLLIAVCSGLALLVGLLLIHVPRLRSTTLLAFVVVALTGLAVASPDLALLLTIGASLGGVIAALAAAWSGLTSGRVVAKSVSLSTYVPRPREAATSQTPVTRPDRSSRISRTSSATTAALEARP
jgi:hypothetical protein